MTNGQEKSDLFIVAMKPANKPGRPGAESVEPGKRTEGNTGEQHTRRTLSRASVSQRLDRVRRPLCAKSLVTQGGSPVRESRMPGSVRGMLSNEHPYRDSLPLINASTNAQKGTFITFLLRCSPNTQLPKCQPGVVPVDQGCSECPAHGKSFAQAGTGMKKSCNQKRDITERAVAVAIALSQERRESSAR
jgi:hypothetical protein